jgi:lactate racemase
VKLHLDYGQQGLDVELPERTQVLQMRDVPGLPDVEARILGALNAPVGSDPLSVLARGRGSACVVIADITRPVPNRLILPPVLRTLEAAGIPRERITILIGTGLHRPNEGDELVALVGGEVASHYRCVNHVARARDNLVQIGATSCGAPIWIDRVYVEADLKIATSLIEPHLMAGYSGGRKAICPGIVGVDTMRVLHGPRLMADPACAEGVIEGNPFHRQALEVARQAGVDFSFNVCMNARREVTGLFCGDLEQAHAEGVRFVEHQNGAWLDAPADVVVTTSAGYPLDLTLYQTVKGMTAALPVVRAGGTIVIASRCGEGLGSDEFAGLLQAAGSPAAFMAQLQDPGFFEIDQWQLQEMCKVLARARVVLVSEGIPAALHGRLLVEHAPSVEAAVAEAMARYGPQARLAAIPKGPYVLCRLPKEAR